MGLNEVVNALERAEQLLEDGETGPAQDSLSWQRADDDADIQLGKACAMLGTCRQLRQGTNNYVSIVELSSRHKRETPSFTTGRNATW